MHTEFLVPYMAPPPLPLSHVLAYSGKRKCSAPPEVKSGLLLWFSVNPSPPPPAPPLTEGFQICPHQLCPIQMFPAVVSHSVPQRRDAWIGTHLIPRRESAAELRRVDESVALDAHPLRLRVVSASRGNVENGGRGDAAHGDTILSEKVGRHDQFHCLRGATVR